MNSFKYNADVETKNIKPITGDLKLQISCYAYLEWSINNIKIHVWLDELNPPPQEDVIISTLSIEHGSGNTSVYYDGTVVPGYS
jgi:hypothetical protein